MDYNYNLTSCMRYEPDQKERTRSRIVESAARQFRVEGMNGLGVIGLMKASGLTHGGFYKHFKSKDDLFARAFNHSVLEIGAMLAGWAKEAPREEFWKEIVRKYLSIEHCDNPGAGCPVAALAADIARTRPAIRRKIQTSMEAYKMQLMEFMPGLNASEKQESFTIIFAAMVGALSVARTLSSPEEKERLLSSVRNHLLSSF